MPSKTVTCPVCNKETDANINFCSYCRYPIGVKKIKEFKTEELKILLSDLFEVIAYDSKPPFNKKEVSELYDELLHLNWLRPESALLSFIEARILLTLRDKYMKYPLLDLGCGEGLFTSVLFGARVNRKYDAYEAIDFSKPDIYDTHTELPRDFFITRPKPIGFGVDIKESAVRKAKNAGIYDDVRRGDIRKLPFEKCSVSSVFSNMIDDIKKDDLETVFREIGRVLKSNGHFIFTTPTERFRKFLLYYNKAQSSKKRGDTDKYKLYSAFDRGRSEWEPRPLSIWRGLFKKVSFEMVEYIEYAPGNVIKFWDTGFRPYFYYLMGARSMIRSNHMLLGLKNIWIEILKNYLLKYTRIKARNGAFAVIVARKI